MLGDNAREMGREGGEQGLVAYAPGRELREAMRQAVEHAVPTAGPDFGEALRGIQAILARADPLVLTGALAMYGGTAEAGTNPEFSRLLDIFAFPIELVQALAFRARAGPMDFAKAFDRLDPFCAVQSALIGIQVAGYSRQEIALSRASSST